MPSVQATVDLNYAGIDIRCKGKYTWDRADSMFELDSVESPTNGALPADLLSLSKHCMTWDIISEYCREHLDQQPEHSTKEPFAGYKQGE